MILRQNLKLLNTQLTYQTRLVAPVQSQSALAAACLSLCGFASLKLFVLGFGCSNLGFSNLTVVLLKEHARRGDEGLLNIVSGLGRCLHKSLNTLFFGKGFALLVTNFSFVLFVFFVAHKENLCVWLALVLDLCKPVLQIHVRVQLRDVVSQKHGVGTSVEDLGDALERLLASSVPNLKFEGDVFHSDQQRSEFDSHCHFVVLLELVVAHAVHQAGLSDSRVSNYDQFKQEVLLQGGRAAPLDGNNLVR